MATNLEIWKPVVGYEGSYEVSSLGRVRSLPRTVMRRNGSPQTWPGKILTQSSNRGYKLATLSVPGEGHRTLKVHQLVARAFHGEPEPGQEVRHSNDVRDDNRAENLLWGTRYENMQDAIRNGAFGSSAQMCKNNHPRSPENRLAYRGRTGQTLYTCRECRRDQDRRRAVADPKRRERYR